ncbi:hypothetical protein HYE55_02450, partial [Aggregatibacter actinomycetemcomitans]|nr:hypothetical protein [Aggregatibacter actinomycetemcomitans]
QEFGNHKISPPEIEKYFHKALESGFKIEGSIINIVKSLCCLSGNLDALKAHSHSFKNEYGHNLTEVELAELLYEQLKNTHNA